MANIGLFKVTDKWTSLEDIIGNGFSFDSETTYIIECRGNGGVLLLESDTLPENSNRSGSRLDGFGYKLAEYKLGTKTLYIRLDVNSSESGVNVSTKEEE